MKSVFSSNEIRIKTLIGIAVSDRKRALGNPLFGEIPVNLKANFFNFSKSALE